MFVSQIFDEVLDILGTTDKSKGLKKLTQAVQTLMQSGHYFHTNAEADICTGWDGQTITLPRGIEVPLGVNVDGSPQYFRGRLFQYNVNKGGMYNPVDWAWDDRGMVSTQMDIRQPSQLVAVAENDIDAGKIIRVIGTDANNRDIRSQAVDGTGVDGLLVPVHSMSDFPYGTILPDGVTITTRSATVSPFVDFLSIDPHQLTSGAEMTVTSIQSGGVTPPLPVPLVSNQKYYVGVIPDQIGGKTISLFNAQLDAKNNTSPIRLQSILAGNSVRLTDSRPINMYTSIKLQDGLPAVAIDSANEVTFARRNGTNIVYGVVNSVGSVGSVISSIKAIYEDNLSSVNLLQANVSTVIGDDAGSLMLKIVSAINANSSASGFQADNSGYQSLYGSFRVTKSTNVAIARLSFVVSTGGAAITSIADTSALLPNPLKENTSYFVNQLDSGLNYANLQVYASLNDAQHDINSITLTGSSGDFDTFIRKQIVPQTKLTFTADPGYATGDTVQASTNGGTLPQPLIAAQNYYVCVLNETPPAVTLHTTYADAIAGVNPISLTTAGTGQNSIARLLPATASSGTRNNISVSGLNLPSASGAGAVVVPQISGPLTSMTVGQTGGGYSSATATLSDTGGYKYVSAPTVLLQNGSYTVPATLTATIATDPATNLGYVSGVTVVNGGQGYDLSNPPTVVFSGGLASGGFVPNATVNVSRGIPTGTFNSISNGQNLTLGQQLVFADTVIGGSGAMGHIATSGTGATYTVVNSGSGYSSPSIVGVLLNPNPVSVSAIGASTTLSSIKVFASGAIIGTELLAAPMVGISTTVTTAVPAIVAQINANSAVSKNFATAASGNTSFYIHSGSTINVLNVGNVGSKILTIPYTSMSNSGTGSGTISAPIDLLAGNPYTLVSGDTTPALLAASIAAQINLRTGTTQCSAISSGSTVIIKLPYNIFAASLSLTTDGGTTFYATASPSVTKTTVSVSAGSITLSGVVVSPVFNPIVTTGVVTGVNLLPYGSGAAASVNVNTISGAVNGVSITQTGAGYLYPPRVAISSPNQLNPQIQVVASGAVGATVTAINAKLSDTSTSANLLSATITVASGNSVADIATAIKTNINAATSTNGGYSAALLSTSSDTVIVYAPTGKVITGFTITTSGTAPAVSTQQSIPSQATASATITTSFVTGYKVVSSGSGYTTAPAVNLSGGNGSGATATAVIDKYGIGKINVTSGGIGYPDTLLCAITDTNGGTGTGASANVVVSGGAVVSVNLTNFGSGYSHPAITFIDPNGGSLPSGANAAVCTFEYTGVLTNANVVAEGTGYTTPPTVTITPSTGMFVSFTSTGTLPAPIVQGATYRAENPSSGSGFTLKNDDFSDVNITSTGSGNLYLVLSRSFAIGFTGLWSGNFSGIQNTPVRLQSDYQLPVTTPPTDETSGYFIVRQSDTSAILYQDAAETIQIIPIELGVGQAYFAVSCRSAGVVYNNSFIPNSSEFLSDLMKVQFSSLDGTFPSPIQANTNYLLKINGNYINLLNSTFPFLPISITSLGHGNVSMNIIRDFAAASQSSFYSDNCIFNKGDEITVRPSSGDTLPFPLFQNTTYYVYRIGVNFGLSTTKNSITPVIAKSTGNTVDSFFYCDLIRQPTLVKAIAHVEKPDTVGYVSLYAFDYGRSNDMALIGQYHPSETNPKYRRIRIGRKAAWARIIYRVKSPEFTSEYDYVPLENPRAIIAAVHAIDLEDKDFLEQAQKYWQTAIAYLKNENESMDGHAMQTPQINNITYGDGTDPIMF